jgi:hypothetical protein
MGEKVFVRQFVATVSKLKFKTKIEIKKLKMFLI